MRLVMLTVKKYIRQYREVAVLRNSPVSPSPTTLCGFSNRGVRGYGDMRLLKVPCPCLRIFGVGAIVYARIKNMEF